MVAAVTVNICISSEDVVWVRVKFGVVRLMREIY